MLQRVRMDKMSKMDAKDIIYLAAILATTGLGRAKLPELVQAMGSAQAVFEAEREQLLATGLVSDDAVTTFLSKRRRDLPQRLERYCELHGVRLVSYMCAEYPKSLLRIADPPLVLYVKGTLPKADYCLAVVGSRECTEYGKKAAKLFTKDLAKRGIPIISGGARGIDTTAHEACLSVGGQTVAVLGCGLNIAYPEENAPLFERIVAKGGAVISEYAPGTQPIARNFPARNRIIVGLSQGVLVAEAKLKSGAIITANIAADEGREVYCVPGNIFDKTSLGCHELIRTGAKLVDSPQDILEDKAQWELAQREKMVQPSMFDFVANDEQEESQKINTSELGARLLDLLKGGSLSLEELVEGSGTDFASVSMELLELQGAGLINQNQALRYYRR